VGGFLGTSGWQVASTRKEYHGMARQRNYAAERARRNQLARERGYTSLDAQARSRRKGNAAPTDTAAQHRTYDLPTGVPTLAALNAASKRWSGAYSRQTATRYNPRWPVRRRIAFYNAFVKAHTGRDVDRYITDYPEFFDPETVDEVRSTGHHYGKR